MDFLLLMPTMIQGLAMVFDEFYFHRRRGLGRWERIGHPVDTATVLLAYGLLLWGPASRTTIIAFIVASLVSSLVITKDEFVHQKECLPGESWLHAVLFVLHPMALGAAGVSWYLMHDPTALLWSELSFLSAADLNLALYGQAALISGFLIYQTVYWNGPWKKQLQKS